LCIDEGGVIAIGLIMAIFLGFPMTIVGAIGVENDSLPEYGGYIGRIVSVDGSTIYLSLESGCGNQKLYEVDIHRFFDMNDVRVMGANARVEVFRGDYCGDHEKMIDIVSP
jgi:hypothetical protein